MNMEDVVFLIRFLRRKPTVWISFFINDAFPFISWGHDKKSIFGHRFEHRSAVNFKTSPMTAFVRRLFVFKLVKGQLSNALQQFIKWDVCIVSWGFRLTMSIILPFANVISQRIKYPNNSGDMSFVDESAEHIIIRTCVSLVLVRDEENVIYNQFVTFFREIIEVQQNDCHFRIELIWNW